MSNPILITGGRPTGNLHLGHYLGAFKRTVDIHRDYNSYFIISNFHMLTTKKSLKNLEEMPGNILGMVAECIAMGMNPDNINFYIQSDIEEMPRLFTFIQNHIEVSNLINKDSINEMNSHSNNFSLGLLAYSVMEAADIIGIGADVVPVGIDNIDHLDITHNIIDSMNSDYSLQIKKPKVIQSVESNIVGLDIVNKMSKSLNNCIYLKDVKEDIYKKLKSVEENNREIILLNYKSSLSNHYEVNDINTFEELIDLVISLIDPIAQKRKMLMEDYSYLLDVIKKGTDNANQQFNKNVQDLLKQLGLNKNSIFTRYSKIEQTTSL